MIFENPIPVTTEFRSFIDLMGDVFTSSTYSYDPSTKITTIELSCTGYIMECVTVDINGTGHLIKSFVYDTSISIAGEITPGLDLTITVPEPHYFYGEPVNVGPELSKIGDEKDKLPMVYLSTPVVEKFDPDKFSPIEKSVNLVLFLLHSNDVANWFIQDHWDNVINSMYYMANQLAMIVEKDRFINNLTAMQITGYAKIGDLLPKGDPRKNMFSDRLTGVKLDLGYKLRPNRPCKIC